MGRPTFKVTLANEDVVMIAVVRVRGTVRTIEQPLHVPDDGQVVVRLADELAP